MVEEFENAVKALSDYEVSEPVLSAHGYHVIMRLPLSADATVSVSNDGTPVSARRLYADNQFNELMKNRIGESVLTLNDDVAALKLTDRAGKNTSAKKRLTPGMTVPESSVSVLPSGAASSAKAAAAPAHKAEALCLRQRAATAARAIAKARAAPRAKTAPRSENPERPTAPRPAPRRARCCGKRPGCAPARKTARTAPVSAPRRSCRQYLPPAAPARRRPRQERGAADHKARRLVSRRAAGSPRRLSPTAARRAPRASRAAIGARRGERQQVFPRTAGSGGAMTGVTIGTTGGRRASPSARLCAAEEARRAARRGASSE